MNQEEHLLARFFVRTKRERYVEMITNPKKRQKFLHELAHFSSLDPRYCVALPSSQQHPEHIAAILARKGAPQTCWVTSENSDLDSREMLVLEALKEVVGRQMGTFLSCIAGKLAYYEGEGMGNRSILQRKD